MADDIVLTVRVRDLTRGDFSQIRQRLRGMDGDIRRVGQSSDLTAQRTERLRQGLKGVSTGLKDLRRNGGGANHEMTFMRRTLSLLERDLTHAARAGELTQEEFGRLRDELRGTRLDFDYLDRDIQRHSAIAQRAARETAAAQREASQRIQTLLRDESAAYREAARRQRATQMETARQINVLARAETAAYREEARRQTAARRESERQQIAGVSRLSSAFKSLIKSSGNRRGLMLTVAVWEGLIGLAPILAGLLTTVLGAAFIGLGAFALRGSDNVKKAFKDMKTSISSDLREAAQPMEKYLVKGIQQLSAEFNKMKPALQEAFSSAGPLISPLVTAITSLVSEAMPGFNAALSRSEPVMEGFATMTASLGKGIGDMFDQMTAGGGEALGDWLASFGGGIGGILSSLGTLMSSIAQNDELLAHLENTLKIVELALITLGPAIDLLSKAMIPLTKGIEMLLSGWEELIDFVGLGNVGTLEAAGSSKELAAAQLEEAAAAATASAALQAYNDQIAKNNGLQQTVLSSSIAFQRSIYSADKAVDKFKGTLKVSNGELQVTKQADQQVADAINNVARQTSAYAKAQDDAGASQKKINGIYATGRKELIRLFTNAGLAKDAAKKLANQLLQTPDKTVRLKGEASNLKKAIADAHRRLKTVKDAKIRAKIEAEISELERKAREAQARIDAIQGKTVVVNYVGKFSGFAGGKLAQGGLIKKATGGMIRGPGTGTSDDVPIAASNGEFIVNAKETRKHRSLLEKINDGTLRAFAKGGLTSGQKSARSELGSALSISTWGRAIGRKKNEVVSSLTSAGSLGELASALNKWQSMIKRAASGGVEKRLLKALDKAGHSLIKYEKKLIGVNAALEKAKSKLHELKDAAASMKESIKSGIMGSANITGLAAGGTNVTTGSIIGNLQTSKDQAKALADALKALKKRGLNAQSLSEIAAAGVEGGGLETAQALMGASASDIKLINALEKAIAKSAGSAGKTTADAMYKAGIKAAEGVVKGLEKQKKSLEKTMSDIAKAFAKTLKRELGIKSKSSGGPIGAAVGGPRGSRTLVGEMGPEIVDLPYGSMVSPAGKSRQMMANGGGGGGEMTINLSIAGKNFEQITVDTVRKAVRVRGGNVQAALGQ